MKLVFPIKKYGSGKTHAMNGYFINHMKKFIKTVKLEELKIKEYYKIRLREIEEDDSYYDDILYDPWIKLSKAERLEQLKKKREEEKEHKEHEKLELLLSAETLLNEFYKRLFFVEGPVFEKPFILYTHPKRIQLN